VRAHCFKLESRPETKSISLTRSTARDLSRRERFLGVGCAVSGEGLSIFPNEVVQKPLNHRGRPGGD
jgi:hypothetical protein